RRHASHLHPFPTRRSSDLTLMTFSIVARGTDGTSWGVAVASKFLAVGSAVPAAAAGVGAIATQSYANLAYRPDGLRLLREGRDRSEEHTSELQSLAYLVCR